MLRLTVKDLTSAAAWRKAHQWVPLVLLLCTGSTGVYADNREATPVLHLFTEPFPPFSMTLDGAPHAASADEVTGFAAETFKELMRRAGVPATLQMVPWKRAYAQALENPGHGAFPTFRTPSTGSPSCI